MTFTEEQVIEIVNDCAFELDEQSKQKLKHSIYLWNHGEYIDGERAIKEVINRCNWKFGKRELKEYLNISRSKTHRK